MTNYDYKDVKSILDILNMSVPNIELSIKVRSLLVAELANIFQENDQGMCRISFDWLIQLLLYINSRQ